MCDQHVEISIWDVGDQTIRTREEVPPDPHPTCKPAGGRREVNNQDGETWGRMEECGSRQPFLVQLSIISDIVDSFQYF